MISLEKFAEISTILVAAHRGASGEAPENSLASFALAIEQGADMIEIDIQITSDKNFVVYHNSSIGSPTKSPKKISSLSLDYLKQIDIGSDFSEKFAGETIPTFSETLDLLKSKVYLSAEIKSFNEQDNVSILEKLIDLLYSKGMNHYTILSSFHYDILKKVKEIDKNIHTAAISIPSLELSPTELLSQFDFDAYICSISKLTKKISDDCFKNNIKLGVYSIDTAAHLQKALKHKVFALGTNFPSRIKQLLDEYQKLPV